MCPPTSLKYKGRGLPAQGKPKLPEACAQKPKLPEPYATETPPLQAWDQPARNGA